jgi:hypothetical protein
MSNLNKFGHRPSWDDQFRETEEEKAERWRRTRAKQKVQAVPNPNPNHYYLRFCGRPLCEYMNCNAGRIFCKEAGVSYCSYPSFRDARSAMKRINKQPGWAGAASIHEGVCPRMAELIRNRS